MAPGVALVGLMLTSGVVTPWESVTLKLVNVAPLAPVTKPWIWYVSGALPNRQKAKLKQEDVLGV